MDIIRRKAIIFDVDGTIADCQHRLHHLANPELSRNEQWDRFFGDMSSDPPIEPVIAIAEAWEEQRSFAARPHVTNSTMDAAIIVVSARPDTYREQTVKWLAHVGMPYDKLYMRAGGDQRVDATVKAEILEQIRADGYDPFLAIDDRQQVVDMWRANGIVCLQNAPLDQYAGYGDVYVLPPLEAYSGDNGQFNTDFQREQRRIAHGYRLVGEKGTVIDFDELRRSLGRAANLPSENRWAVLTAAVAGALNAVIAHGTSVALYSDVFNNAGNRRRFLQSIRARSTTTVEQGD